MMTMYRKRAEGLLIVAAALAALAGCAGSSASAPTEQSVLDLPTSPPGTAITFTDTPTPTPEWHESIHNQFNHAEVVSDGTVTPVPGSWTLPYLSGAPAMRSTPVPELAPVALIVEPDLSGIEDAVAAAAAAEDAPVMAMDLPAFALDAK